MAPSKKFLANGEKGRIKVGSEVTCEGRGRGCLVKFTAEEDERVKKNQIEMQIVRWPS